MPCGNSSPVSRRRFASASRAPCSTSFQSMKRQPAAGGVATCLRSVRLCARVSELNQRVDEAFAITTQVNYIWVPQSACAPLGISRVLACVPCRHMISAFEEKGDTHINTMCCGVQGLSAHFRDLDFMRFVRTPLLSAAKNESIKNENIDTSVF